MTGRTSRREVFGAAERVLLDRFLDFHREAIIAKAEGLSDEDARRPLVASGTSIAGIVKHLHFVERYWFQIVMAGEAAPVPWTKDDPDADWRVEGEDLESLIAGYRAECVLSRAVVAAHDLEDAAAKPGQTDVTLRWILVHMIEETARHAGQADILREQIDGAVGE